MTDNATKEMPTAPGFYLAKSKSDHWFLVYLSKDGVYSWTSEMNGIENTPNSPNDFLAWMKITQ